MIVLGGRAARGGPAPKLKGVYMDQAPSTAAAGRLRAACEVAFVLCVESVDGAGTAAPVRKTSALVELSFEVSDQNCAQTIAFLLELDAEHCRVCLPMVPSVLYETSPSPIHNDKRDRCVPLWSPGRNSIGHVGCTCPTHVPIPPMGVVCRSDYESRITRNTPSSRLNKAVYGFKYYSVHTHTSMHAS